MKFEDLLVREGLILRDQRTLDMGRSRAYSGLFGVDLDGYNTLVFFRDASSRFVRKDALALISRADGLADALGKVCKRRVLFLNSPLCSKARAELKNAGWKVFGA